MDELKATHRVVVVELRGHGASQPVGDGGFGLGQQVEDLRSVLVALDVRDAVLVGHSAGGYVVLELLARAPDVVSERVRRVVTVGTAGSMRAARDRAVLRFSASRLFAGVLKAGALGRALVRRGAFGRAPRPDWVEATRAMAAACPRSTKAAWVAAVSGTSVLDGLSSSSPHVDITVATGSHDTVVTPAHLTELADACRPRADVVVLDGAGHMAPLERPHEIADLVRRAAR